MIITVPDVHLGASLSVGKTPFVGALNSRTQDKIDLLKWTIQKVKETKAKRVVLLGDIFETQKPDYTLFEIFLKFLKELEDLGAIVDIIFGNHDMLKIGDKYFSVLDLVRVFNKGNFFIHSDFEAVEYEGYNLVFAPFRDRRSFNVESNEEALKLLKQKIQSLKKDTKNILFGHLTLQGALYVGDEIDDHANELICPLDIFEGFDWVFMGHIHKPQNLTPNIMHVGSLDISNFGESDHDKILVSFDNSNNTIKKIPVPTRSFFHFQINIPKDQDAISFITDYLVVANKQKSLKNSIIKLEIFTDEHQIERKDIDKILTSFEIFHLPSYVNHKNISVVSQEKKALMAGVSDPKQAIQIYSNSALKSKDDKFKKTFVEYSNNILEKYVAIKASN